MAVHLHELGAEERGFVAARSRADLHYDVVVLVGVLGKKGYAQLVGVAVHGVRKLLQLLFQHIAHIMVAFCGKQLLAFLEVALVREVSLELFRRGLQLGVLL